MITAARHRNLLGRMIPVGLSVFISVWLMLTTLAGTAHTQEPGNALCPPDSSYKLHIKKQVSSPIAHRGDTLTYTLWVRHEYTEELTDIRVEDEIPSFTHYVLGSVTGEGRFDVSLNRLDWVIPLLQPRVWVKFQFMVTVDSSASGNYRIINVGCIVAPDTVWSNKAKTKVKPPQDEFELQITKQVDSSVASPGSILEYTLTVANAGEGTAFGIGVEDGIPAFTTFIPGSVTMGGVYDPANDKVRWTMESLGSDGSVELSFGVAIDSSAEISTGITNFATITVPDLVTSNVVTTIVDIPSGAEDSLTIVNDVNTSEAHPGDTLTYSILITNPGPAAVNGVVVTDSIPDFATYVEGSATGGCVFVQGISHAIGGVLTWTVDHMSAGQGEQYEFKVVIDIDAPENAVVLNQANITAPYLVIGNPVTTVVQAGLFTIEKAVDKTDATNTDTLTYTILYSNVSGGSETNVVIIDELDQALVFIPGSATYGGIYEPDSRTLIWNLGNVPAVTSGSVRFQARPSTSVTNGQTVNNVAIVSGDDLAPVTSAPVIVTLRFPDITLSKSASPSMVMPGDTVSYTVIASNDGASLLSEVVLVDDLPDDFDFVAGSARINGCLMSLDDIEPAFIRIGELDVSESVVISYRAAVSPMIATSGVHVNSASLHGVNVSGDSVSFGPAQAMVAINKPLLSVDKKAGVASGTIGSLIPYTIVIENLSDVAAINVAVIDSMPAGFFYADGSTIIDGLPAADPTGNNPYMWSLGTIPAGGTVVIEYRVVLGTSVSAGVKENTAWAQTGASQQVFLSPMSSARINVVSTTLPGAIRGRMIVDCDDDGVIDSDLVPVGVDIYLDDGSQSRVNENGMFYFSSVTSGTHVVALDERDLDGFVVPEGEPISVFVHVHEAGESYITFRLCLDQPYLSVTKRAAVAPIVKATKTADVNAELSDDTVVVVVDYTITTRSNGGACPTVVRVIDSIPQGSRLFETGKVGSRRINDNLIEYEVSIAQLPTSHTISYSLKHGVADLHDFIINKVCLEGKAYVPDVEGLVRTMSPPITVEVGPLRRVPRRDIRIDVTGAHFETAKASLLSPAIPILSALADSMLKYPDARIVVEGHADYRRIHTRKYPSNWELSEDRARTVVDWLIEERGVRPDSVTLEGFAATRPVDPGHTEEAWQKNRRVEVIIRGETREYIDVNRLATGHWEASATLNLEPTNWETLFAEPTTLMERDLNDMWTVSVTVSNAGPALATDAMLTDVLPDGVVYIEGSASLNGVVVPAEVTDGHTLTVRLGRIGKEKQLELRYRVRATQPAQLSGGGAASVNVHGPRDGIVTQESNPVRFAD